MKTTDGWERMRYGDDECVSMYLIGERSWWENYMHCRLKKN